MTKKLDITGAEDPAYDDKKALIDELYTKGSGDEILDFLIEKNLVPGNWKDNKGVVKECAQLKTQLDQKKAQVEQQKKEATFENYKADITEKRLQLEAKPNKTEDELKILQSYLYLEQNPQISEELFQESLQVMDDSALYIGIGSMVRQSLIGSFTDF
ncbi:MAG: hypothetical protein LBG52_03665 [Candidatus Peribacteria bacterium]|jgi:DNA repair exonuclease SbcCD nuclease subunit|nr:hypothetical protein [Candidatus Peribacteria bacterium]